MFLYCKLQLGFLVFKDMLLFFEGVEIFLKFKLVIFLDEEFLKQVEELYGLFFFVLEIGMLDICFLLVLFDFFNFCLNILSVDVLY